MELLLSHSHLHGENNSPQSEFYTDRSHKSLKILVMRCIILATFSLTSSMALQDEDGQIFKLNCEVKIIPILYQIS